ncbi:bifunctional phosphopantothenoylcysteine decarboxylase/phosphopantothenate--cysteine ligase CoaBC [Helicobacter sp. MIT 21-1697]|uniref:bifunctional phosphopantothenoylcysteine decarboxylase/phosphopantothenate--cysteine ligase CoaBC n=1 Tax=Helicobacter sp. MIT 21-1697 TaxID=2993733 RepID=UPI00224A6F68|nr:bifunctional phosphopantothenoylcysteine decarboxylase/phosphopantothenate--cysteine ligase CoaBC [Helicobacter sp. MIT 21-1697]MCX2717228.1 bifunctional phosphopantothenoylcysteine decarboxylase/phosphopantothenate--cysteine ligase CoaBC [Helicobacter sp. MIT 21-1697]
MQYIFEDKKILILVSGSIAAYKMLDCISQLIKFGAHIRVVMSKESRAFIQPLSFEAISHNIVLHDENQSWHNSAQEVSPNHIFYAKWADIVLIAPATANTIAKIACGIADNVLLSTLLASSAPKLLAPAMNTAMLNAPQTQNNLVALADMGYEIIAPRSSILMCGDEGEGALAQVEEIIYRLGRGLMKDAFWHKRNIIISGGGSKESIDEVRYISNRSSGKQASYLALALYMLGAEVTFISSAFPFALPLDIKCANVESVTAFDDAIYTALDRLDSMTSQPIVFMAAALADYAPKPQIGKLKKEHIGEKLTLECLKTKDILASLSSQKAYKVGFKAEVDDKNALQYAQNMLETKKCEMVCLNIIDSQNPFGGETNRVKIITHKDIQEVSGSKLEVAFDIARAFSQLHSLKGE